MFYNKELNKEAYDAINSGKLLSFDEWWDEYSKLQTTSEDYPAASDAWYAAIEQCKKNLIPASSWPENIGDEQ